MSTSSHNENCFCQNCNKEFEVEIFDIINAGLHNELAKKSTRWNNLFSYLSSLWK